jgi:hypothetical protein
MMNPSVYLREAERIENETALRVRPGKHERRVKVERRGYSHEQLPSGCILYQMASLGEPAHN